MAKKGLHLNIYRVPGGVWRCDIKLNTSGAGEGLTFRGTSEDEDGQAAQVMGSVWSKLSHAGRALKKARTLAKAILSNPALAQAFPQYVAPALIAIDAMEKAEAHGKLPEVKKQLTDPTLKKFARELDEMSKGQRSAMSGGGICLANDAAPHQRHKNMNTRPRGPFGLPSGNPHPFAAYVKQQIARGQFSDPLSVQKMARMHAYQRGMARNSR